MESVEGVSHMTPNDFILKAYHHGQKRLMPALSKLVEHYSYAGGTTDLCRIMTEEKSDKGGCWHTYTQLYHNIFLDLQPVSKILEVGIGTNNLDVPSNMGPQGTPGASLRGWSRFFPNAEVIGADVDRRILFSEPRISTYFVDQLDQTALRELSAQVGGGLDIIIDDGLHTFEANINTFVGLFHCLKSGGIYVIEDIAPSRDLENFNLWFSKLRLDGAFIGLPSDQNKWDNAAIVIYRP
jgi:hypothetical protein